MVYNGVTVWIHRATSCDLLVNFYNYINAYNFAIDLLNQNDGSIDDNVSADNLSEKINRYEGYMIGSSPYLQLSIHKEGFSPIGYDPNSRGITCWNHEGYALVTEDQVYSLVPHNNPDGFITGNPTIIWQQA